MKEIPCYRDCAAQRTGNGEDCACAERWEIARDDHETGKYDRARDK